MAPVRSTGAVVAVVSVSMALLSLFLYKSKPSSKKTELSLRSKENHRDGLVGAIGNTPLIRINSLSDATGCEALESGGLAPGGVVTKGSAGSTAISLATVAPAYGCKCHVVIPDDAAIEKSQILEALGATVERVRPVSMTLREHFVNIARRRATEANEKSVIIYQIVSYEEQRALFGEFFSHELCWSSPSSTVAWSRSHNCDHFMR
ncbi:cysteine synthase 2 isoform X2 [Malus domestica]|uniref:cysteine synthase 2 isoform X2 n=1 Tax=Malus domestica TaxID=3750 RepID=UPI0004990907|nr:cysteine synthase 2 isoform X2 [Malus domestica]